jgi:hypothetical protein
MNEATKESVLPAKTPGRPPLACRLRPKEWIGRQGPVPNMGEVELENCSNAPLEIEYTMTPLQFLDLDVIGPGGEIVSEGHFSDRFSPTAEPQVLRLMPGEKFTSRVSLLSTVRPEKRSSGGYTIRASYRYRDQLIMAEPLHVQLPAK